MMTAEIQKNGHFYWKSEILTGREGGFEEFYSFPVETWEEFLLDVKKGLDDEKLEKWGLDFIESALALNPDKEGEEDSSELRIFKRFFSDVREGKEKNWTPGKLFSELAFSLPGTDGMEKEDFLKLENEENK